MDSKGVQIVVLTRFSVYNFPSNVLTTHRADIHTHEDYMKYMYSAERMDAKMTAFTQLTLPSIASQIYKPSSWLIFYSEHLPAHYKHELEQAVRPHSFIELVHVAKYGDIIPATDDNPAPPRAPRPGTTANPSSLVYTADFIRAHVCLHSAQTDKHWTEKDLKDMTERDWRIFREDFNISYKGNSDILPMRNWSEGKIPSELIEVRRGRG